MTQSFPVGTSGQMPAIGLGCWKIPQATAPELVRAAIQVGYRHLDCACDYGNEAAVGTGLQRALSDGVCRREEIWVTSKLWNSYHAKEHVRLAAERSLRDLQLDVLDLYLVHFPIATAFVPFEERYPPGWVFDPQADRPQMQPVRVPIAETWKAMEDLVKAGLVRHIGVSNFGVSLLRDLLNTATIAPAVLQIELHPYLVQAKLLRFCQEAGITVTGFSPLGALSYVSLGMATKADSVLEQPAIQAAAAAHQRTPAQIALRWGVQRGTAVIPMTSRVERLAENLQVCDFTLTDAEMLAIAGLDRHQRYNDPGVFCEQAFGTYFPIYE